MIKVRIRKETPVQFAALLLNSQEFDTYGNLSARKEFRGFGALVTLDDAERDQLYRSQYAVYSYDTPIAWRDEHGEWHFNADEYSVTTTRHQHLVFAAISQL